MKTWKSMNMKQTMKNLRLYYILILCGLLLLSGCGISNRQEQDSGGTDSAIMELDEGEEKADVNELCIEDSKNGSALIDETADAEINIVKTYKEGCIYKLTAYITPFMSSWYFPSGSNMSIYLYVTSDKIYRVLPYAQPEPGGQSVNFYDDDILLTETLDTEEKLRSIGVLELVCQEEVQEDYFSITWEANRIRYDRSEIKPNGESGDKTLFVWEEGKGLVEFGTGFGPGPMEVHIDEIRDINEFSAEHDGSGREGKRCAEDHDGTKDYTLNVIDEGYELVLYNQDKEEIFSMIYPREPRITDITESVLEISVSTGNPSRYVFYFDRQNGRVSETFFNPILFGGQYVAYMEENRLILTDLFEEGILHEEIIKDYSKTADPVSAVISIEVLENRDIMLQYYKGKDMEEVSEIVGTVH